MKTFITARMDQSEINRLTAAGFKVEQGGFAQVIFAVKPVLPLRGGGRKSAVACLPNPQGGHRNAAELGNDTNAIDGSGLQ